MNAVNLLPNDLRRGAGSPGRSGSAVYVVLGVLAVAVVLVSVTAVMRSQVADRERQVASAEAEAASAEQRAATLTRYKALAADTNKRVTGIKRVAAGRIDWADTLREVSESIGSEVYFSSVSASTSSASGAGAGAASNPLRSAIEAPAVDIEGCARDHKAVARLMTRFRSMDDVQRVSLSNSDAAGAVATADPAAAGGADAGCSDGGRLAAQFKAVIFLEEVAQPVAAAPATATTTTPSTGASK